MSDANDEIAASENACPFCGSILGCEHLLLLVDLTFRTAEGGALYDTFRDRWSTISDQEDIDFDERESFDGQLDEVDSLADTSLEYVLEGGPGMTSEYGMYFCSSKERVDAAVKKFEAEPAESVDVEADQCPFCRALNAPAADDTCAHHVGWKRDGAIELDADLEDLQRGWQGVQEKVQTNAGGPDFDGLVADLVADSAQNKKLFDLAACDADFSDLLETVGVRVGGGRQTEGVFGGSGYNLYLDDRQSMNEAAAFYNGLCERAEELNNDAPTERASEPVAEEKGRRKRAVLLIVTKWPGGTMAFKFGSAMAHALCPSGDDVKLVQLEPERIFRAETAVSEEEFRRAMATSGVSYSGRVLFVEM